jgi:hypothetical protein
MTDVLANYGLADAEAVAAALAHYDGLFTLFNPDVVLCDHAFAGLLAARGRVPGVAIGSPVLLPPPVDGGFPCLEEDAHPAWAADEILEGLNRGLTRAGRFPLESITDLLRVDGIFPFGPRAFDPYANLRSEPVLAPYIHGLRLPRRESKAPLGPAQAPESATRQEVFVYLHGFVQHREPIMEGLLAIKHPVRAFIPGLTAENERRLEARGILVESAPVAIDDILARSRCLVHHGGPNLTVLGLAAGLPQVILAKEFDNRTSAVFVEQRGLGFGTILGQASSGYLAAAVHRAHSDEALRHACIAAAPAFREWLYPDPTAFVAQAICALVDASPPPTVLSDPEP